MRTTAAWAMWRRMQYFTGFTVFFLIIGGWVYYANFYQSPTCFDGKQNAGEAGVDCGGGCVRICSFSVQEPTVKWSRSFRVTDGMYNAVGYVENSNREAASPEIKYKFTLLDATGVIKEVSGTTILPPDGEYPIFEGRIATGSRVPTRTFLEIEPVEMWQPATAGREQFSVVSRELLSADARPRLDATLRNNELEEVKEVEVVATIFNAEGTALASSRTFVDNFAPRSDLELFFTWPEPIATTLRSCEVPTDVLVAIDVSGSMNNDQANPPEPLTSVKEAAARFINRLGENDQSGLVTFATGATLVNQLTAENSLVSTAVGAITIDPSEESGFTNTGEGLIAAANELTSARHNENARKVMVILTDGLATAPGETEEAEKFALDAATSARGAGIDVYSIGLGESVKMEFVSALSSTPEQSFQAISSGDVDRIYQTITSSLCEQGAAVIDIVPKSTSGFIPLR
ncbi:VWA domain-containing protein [Candidatus Nomurabacteria bacterium]|nr:VWA domain-containing protein [Candidatus Nomurabacteria bacterium]